MRRGVAGVAGVSFGNEFTSLTHLEFKAIHTLQELQHYGHHDEFTVALIKTKSNTSYTISLLSASVKREGKYGIYVQ